MELGEFEGGWVGDKWVGGIWKLVDLRVDEPGRW